MKNDPPGGLADTARAPAPWDLRGRGYISLLRFDRGKLDGDPHIPPGLRGRRQRSPFALMMFVDYSESPVGPYRELLFIPGRFDLGDGHAYYSISRIFVSTQDSVVNGQQNWGIPKEQAQFDVRYGDEGLDRIRVSQDGEAVADLDYRRYPVALPITTGLLPSSLLSLCQHHQGRAFFYSPSARGRAQPARLLRAESNGQLFPDLAMARPAASIHIPRFQMHFPKSRIEAL